MSDSADDKDKQAVEVEVEQDNFFGDPSLGKGGRVPNLENGLSRKGQAVVDMYLEDHYATGGKHPFAAMLDLAAMTAEQAKKMAKDFGVSKEQAFAAKMMGMNQVLKRTTPELKKMEIDATGGALVQFTTYMPPEDIEDLSESRGDNKMPAKLVESKDD